MATVLLPTAAGFAVVYLLIWAAPDAAHSWSRSLVKTAAVALLALAALAAGAPGLIVLGLGLGAAGDFALSRPGTNAFLAGMAAFAAGHLAYAVAFAGPPLADLAGLAGGVPWKPDAGDIGWLVVLVALLVSTEFWLAPHTGALRAPVRAYVLVIGLMAAAALVPTAPGSEALRLGVALFVASDVMLALERFVVRAPAFRRVLALALWPAYWCGQALILLGSLGARGNWVQFGMG